METLPGRTRRAEVGGSGGGARVSCEGPFPSTHGDLPGPLVAGPAPKLPISRRKRGPLRRLAVRLGAPLITATLRALWWTYRVDPPLHLERAERLGRPGEPVVLAFWHRSLFPCVWFVEHRAEFGSRRVYLVSPSVDGDVVARMLERIGATVVRGSATRSAIKSLRELYRTMRAQGATPVLAVDGPQGPAGEFKLGPAILSQLAGVPVLPVACAARPALRLPTWDRLCIPLPFARVRIGFARPWQASPDVTTEDLERGCAELGRDLDGLERELAAGFGPPPSQ